MSDSYALTLAPVCDSRESYRMTRTDILHHGINKVEPFLRNMRPSN